MLGWTEKTLIVRILMRFQRRAAASASSLPTAARLAPSPKPQPDSTLVKTLARGWRWQKLLDDGVYSSVTENSETEGINKSYVSRLLRLTLLAPDNIEAILAAREDRALMLEHLKRPLPASWESSGLQLDETPPCSY
jgi:hypothetical protein